MGYVSDAVPETYAKVFAIITQARDAAVALIQRRTAEHQSVRVPRLNRAARSVPPSAGYGNRLLHGTGIRLGAKSMGRAPISMHSKPATMHYLIEHTCFSVEPECICQDALACAANLT